MTDVFIVGSMIAIGIQFSQWDKDGGFWWNIMSVLIVGILNWFWVGYCFGEAVNSINRKIEPNEN